MQLTQSSHFCRTFLLALVLFLPWYVLASTESLWDEKYSVLRHVTNAVEIEIYQSWREVEAEGEVDSGFPLGSTAMIDRHQVRFDEGDVVLRSPNVRKVLSHSLCDAVVVDVSDLSAVDLVPLAYQVFRDQNGKVLLSSFVVSGDSDLIGISTWRISGDSVELMAKGVRYVRNKTFTSTIREAIRLSNVTVSNEIFIAALGGALCGKISAVAMYSVAPSMSCVDSVTAPQDRASNLLGLLPINDSNSHLVHGVATSCLRAMYSPVLRAEVPLLSGVFRYFEFYSENESEPLFAMWCLASARSFIGIHKGAFCLTESEIHSEDSLFLRSMDLERALVQIESFIETGANGTSP